MKSDLKNVSKSDLENISKSDLENISKSELSDDAVTAWNLDELYDKVTDLIIDLDNEKITDTRLDIITTRLDNLSHAVNCCRQNQSLIDRKLKHQSTITVYHSLALCIWAIAIISVTNIKSIK